jgi:tripartite-type tricarboxylate transporter receptor subunit TctC
MKQRRDQAQASNDGGHIMSIFRGVLAALAAWLIVSPAAAQGSYPERPVRLIVGFTAGSATDISARMVAQKLSESWGVPVTVENIPGAGGGIGVDRVAKSTPDGYTLMWSGNGAITINPSLLSSLPYDPVRDLAPISLLVSMPSILAVNNDIPAKTLQELIALAKAQPGKLSYASPGVGTPQHIAGELIKSLAGIDIVHVPYRGAVITDVIGGRVSIALMNAGAMLSTVRDGKLRGLAVTSLTRSPNMPEFATIAESGFPGFEATSWFCLMAPAGTPQAVIDKVHRGAVLIAKDPDLRAKFAKLGLDVVGNSPAELGAQIKSDIAKWAKVIKSAGIKVGD